MPADPEPDSLKEVAVPYSPPPATQRLIDELYREELIDARAMSPTEKVMAGQQLFEGACRITLAGIRHQFPDASAEQCREILRQRLGTAAQTGGNVVTIDDVALRVANAFNAAGIPYMLVGGFSSNYHGIPRSTKDADFVVQLSAPLNETFARTLGPEFEAEPQLSFETNPGTQRQKFCVAGTLFKVEVFRLSGDPHDQERFQRRRAVEVEGRQVFFPTAEDVIVWKLRWARAKDREDVRAVLGVQQGSLDWPYIESWCDRHGTRALLEEIRRTVPKI